MELVKEIKRYELNKGIKVGDLVLMEDRLSCDKFYASIIKADNLSIKFIKIKTGEVKELTFKACTKYDVRLARIVEDNTYSKGCDEMSVEKTKESDDNNNISSILKLIYGDTFKKNIK